jgi:TolA-binding protein
MRLCRSLAVLAAAGLSACAGTGDDSPTLKSLEGRQIVLAPDPGVPASEDKSITAYRDFLKASPRDRERPEAMRRLGDLEMDRTDDRMPAGKAGRGSMDYRGAIAAYRDLLKAYPNYPGNDRVLYQLARAYEQGGDLENALTTLNRLVHEYPATPYHDEAQFRRGELMFTTRDYRGAEQAYGSIIHSKTHTPYFERALYMHGWSLFKQGRLEDALQSFFSVLDLKMIGRKSVGSLDAVPGLSRADRELVEDTFRVTSLCLENLRGAESIPEYMDSDMRRDYEFRVYEQLGELYIKQERTKDAADTFGAFARRYPMHAQAPLLQARVIDIYQQAGFDTLALQAKKDYVTRYGTHSDFRRANPAAWERAQPLVKTHLAELARRYHAAAQKSRKTEDYQEAVHWYRDYLDSYPTDPQAAQMNFLLAELLFEDKHYAEAAIEYEMAAYHYPPHAKSADAGYAALLAYAEQEKRATPSDLKAVQLAGVDSALRFARAYPHDRRAGPVLANAADKLYALHDPDRAAAIAHEVLTLDPPAGADQRRVAWTVIAHTAFERGAFDRAEHAYGEVLALTPATDPKRGALTERLAASVYKQGEQARAAGNLREAVAHFGRVATVAPRSAVCATAQFDAAAVMIALKDWDGAARTLEDFRRRYPKHPLQADVGSKLAVAYMEQGKWALAAPEFERLAASHKEPQLSREALWQAAGLYEKAGRRAPAARAYERYVRENPLPLEPAEEARYRLADMAKQDGNGARERALLRELLQADQAGGRGRTDRTRYLAANAALTLAEPVFENYRKVALVEPLKKNLKLKKARMEDVLKAYGVAAEYGVADVATASTFRIAELYGDFGRALMSSQRPKGLSKDELEQYNVMLEEQAYPFEEKAIRLHEVNAHRSADGIYDAWVKRSYAALAKFRPVRYGKNERSEVAVDAIR